MKQQKKICNILKALTVLFSALSILFFSGFTVYAFHMRENSPSNPVWSFIFFTWFMAILVLLVLRLFWKVCTQIGNDNSFSLENALYFQQMAIIGTLATISYLLRLIYLGLMHCLTLYTSLYCIFLMLLCFGFTVLCESLSKLSQNAYEMKLENDLTI